MEDPPADHIIVNVTLDSQMNRHREVFEIDVASYLLWPGYLNCDLAPPHGQLNEREITERREGDKGSKVWAKVSREKFAWWGKLREA